MIVESLDFDVVVVSTGFDTREINLVLSSGESNESVGLCL